MFICFTGLHYFVHKVTKFRCSVFSFVQYIYIHMYTKVSLRRFIYAHKTYLYYGKTKNNRFQGFNSFMSTFQTFELLKNRNKTSSPEDFEFTRFDCIFNPMTFEMTNVFYKMSIFTYIMRWRSVPLLFCYDWRNKMTIKALDRLSE